MARWPGLSLRLADDERELYTRLASTLGAPLGTWVRLAMAEKASRDKERTPAERLYAYGVKLAETRDEAGQLGLWDTYAAVDRVVELARTEVVKVVRDGEAAKRRKERAKTTVGVAAKKVSTGTTKAKTKGRAR